MSDSFHSVCVAGTHSGVGKTTVCLGLLALLRRRGLKVQPFKCGPDYIDGGHHLKACGVPSRNLDTWMMGEDAIIDSYNRAVQNADAAIVEGVMGFFDGASSVSIEGSTAHVAKLLSLPVILVVDAKAMARSMAALVKGFTVFEPGLNIAGVIANNVSSGNHAGILRNALESAELPPLLGTLPRRSEWQIPERHLGLVSYTETEQSGAWYETLADGIEENIDTERLLSLCVSEKPTANDCDKTAAPEGSQRVRLGIARDDAFHFYYEDNLDLLEQLGAELVEFSPLRDETLPEKLDGLYIGGGFPEMFADQLEKNSSMRDSVRAFADGGGLIYAECGGLMYLCRTLTNRDGRRRDMCGILPWDTSMESRLRRLGYVEARTLHEGPFGPAGTIVRGHEFHWSIVASHGDMEYAYELKRPGREESRLSGFKTGNVWASYVHVHFASNPDACRAWIDHMRQI